VLGSGVTNVGGIAGWRGTNVTIPWQGLHAMLVALDDEVEASLQKVAALPFEFRIQRTDVSLGF